MLPIFACLFACGGPPVAVSVEAHVKSAPAAGARVMLVPADPRIPATDPAYIYLAKLVSRALAQKGLQPTTTPADGQGVVSIGWVRDAPKVITSTAPALQSGNFRGEPPGLHPGTLRGLSGDPSVSDLTTGVESPEPKAKTVTKYPWTVELKGLDPTGPQAAVLWSVTASGDSDTEDAADIAPELIAAGAPFIGTDVLKKDIRISARDAAVKSLVADGAKASPEPPANTKR